jgi:hypothetical protein
MSAYDESEDKQEVRDIAILASQIRGWAGSSANFEEALVIAWDCLNMAADFTYDMNAQPVLVGLEPATLEVPGEDTEVVCVGTGFSEHTVINWNGGDEATDFIDIEHIKTTVKPSTVQAPLPFTLTVYVHHGGTSSNALDFTFTEPAEEKRRERDGKA